MVKTFYVACWLEKGGVYELRFDFDSQRIVSVKKTVEGTHTSYFAKAGDVLYVLSEIGGPGAFAGKVESFRETDTGLLSIDTLAGIPSGSPHIVLSNDQKVLYVASYTTGAVCSADVHDGSFGSVTSVIGHIGSSANEKRQESSHAHMVCVAPDGAFVVCCDLGTDELRVYSVKENGALAEHNTVQTPAGYGPRHMVFSSDGSYAYVVCELAYRLLTYRYLGNGRLEQVNDTKLREDLSQDQSWGGAIKIAADGTHLFTTNRGRKNSSIDVLSLADPLKPVLTGSLDACSHPRDMMVLEQNSKQYVICLNMTEGSAVFYTFDPAKTRFEKLDETKEIPMPVCIALPDGA